MQMEGQPVITPDTVLWATLMKDEKLEPLTQLFAIEGIDRSKSFEDWVLIAAQSSLGSYLFLTEEEAKEGAEGSFFFDPDGARYETFTVADVIQKFRQWLGPDPRLVQLAKAFAGLNAKFGSRCGLCQTHFPNHDENCPALIVSQVLEEAEK